MLRVHSIAESGAPQEHRTDDDIAQVFRVSNGSLLILGEAGTGKTNLLMELAAGCIAEAETDETIAIPLVFSLPRWTLEKSQPSLEQWLTDDLSDPAIYGLSRSTAQLLIRNSRPILFLDGLDEVAENQRSACVQAIHAYQQSHDMTKLAVSCRVAEYERLPPLNLRTAVRVEKLTRTQVDHYLSLEHMGSVRQMLKADPELLELIDTPLWLQVATLAAGATLDTEVENAPARFRLYTRFVRYALGRTVDAGSKRTPDNDLMNWLGWLASTLKARNQSQFSLEQLDYSWIFSQGFAGPLRAGILGMVCGLVFGLVLGVRQGLVGMFYEPVGGLIGGLTSRLVGGRSGALNLGLEEGLVSGMCFGLVGGLLGAVVGQVITWLVDKSAPRIRLAWLSGLVAGVVGGLIGGLTGGELSGWAAALTAALVRGLVLKQGDIKPTERLYLDWSRWKSGLFHGRGLKAALGIGLGVGLVFALIAGLLDDNHEYGRVFELAYDMVFFGIPLALTAALLFAVVTFLNEVIQSKPLSKPSPNIGTTRSQRYSLTILIVGGGLIAAASRLGTDPIRQPGDTDLSPFVLSAALCFTLLISLLKGGEFAVHHYATRLLIWGFRYAPLRYTQFLNEGVTRLFLHRQAGSYEFFHLTFRDYMASTYNKKKARNSPETDASHVPE